MLCFPNRAIAPARSYMGILNRDPCPRKELPGVAVSPLCTRQALKIVGCLG